MANHRQRRIEEMRAKAGPNAPLCLVCHAPCMKVDDHMVCLRCRRIQPNA